MKEILKESTGKLSSNRIALLLIVIAVLVAMFILLFKDTLTPDWVYLLLGLVTAGFTGKVTQKYTEKYNKEQDNE